MFGTSNPIASQAACRGKPTAWFFEGEWELSYTKGMARARVLCDDCPVSAACLDLAMEHEARSAETHRFGIFGGMTPHQRFSLERRGQEVACPVCSELRDPVLLRDGDLSCINCGYSGEMAPIPNRGDQWTPRHTTLAEEVIAWMVENVEPDGEVLSAAKLSRKMSVRVNDMRRVYEALIADHVMELVGTKLLRRATGATRGWIPPHLRVSH